MSSFGGKDVDEIMKDCDSNGDGKIDFEEFVNAIKKSKWNPWFLIILYRMA